MPSRSAYFWTALGCGIRFERAHHNARQRSATAGNTYDSRIKRTGWAAQQLRANTGVLLDWLKIHDRMGWLDGSICRLDHSDVRLQPYVVDAEEIVKRVEAERRAEGLHRCYGPQAKEHGLGEATPRRRQAVNADLDDEAQLSATAQRKIRQLEENFSADLDDEHAQAQLNEQIREIVRADAAEQGYRIADDPDPPPDSAHDPPGWGQVTEDEPF